MSYSTADSLRPVTLDDVRGAQKMLTGVARATAMEGSRHLSQLVGSPVHLKCENLQRTGSFKLRGAYVRIAGHRKFMPAALTRRLCITRRKSTCHTCFSFALRKVFKIMA